MTRRAAVLALTLVTAALVDGCGASRRSRPGTEADRTVLEVDNQSFELMRIYVVSGGQRVRLGNVDAKSSAELTIPRTVIGNGRELQFLADPLAGDRPSVTNRIWVSPGERVTLMIPP